MIGAKPPPKTLATGTDPSADRRYYLEKSAFAHTRPQIIGVGTLRSPHLLLQLMQDVQKIRSRWFRPSQTSDMSAFPGGASRWATDSSAWIRLSASFQRPSPRQYRRSSSSRSPPRPLYVR